MDHSIPVFCLSFVYLVVEMFPDDIHQLKEQDRSTRNMIYFPLSLHQIHTWNRMPNQLPVCQGKWNFACGNFKLIQVMSCKRKQQCWEGTGVPCNKCKWYDYAIFETPFCTKLKNGCPCYQPVDMFLGKGFLIDLMYINITHEC